MPDLLAAGRHEREISVTSKRAGDMTLF